MKKGKRAFAVILCAVMIFTCAVQSFALTGTEDICPYADAPFDNSSWFSAGDYTLHYRVFEAEAAQRGQIMFLHGFGLSTASFEDMTGYFTSAGYKCVLVDLPSHGYSTRETADMELIDREELVYALMQYLGGNWILAGHSMGGGVAVNIAVSYPESVESLLLYCPQTSAQLTPPISLLMRSSFVTGLFNIIISKGSRIGFVMNLVAKSAIGDSEYLASYDISKISAPLQLDGTGAGMAVMASHAKGPDYDAISQLTVPVLVIQGDNDNIASASNLDKLEAALTDEKSVIFEGANHMFIQVMAQETAETSLDFLAA